MDLIFKSWWLNEEGVVFFARGWAREDDPDVFYFHVDPEEDFEVPVEGVHVDRLYETQEEATTAAKLWLSDHIALYQARLLKLLTPEQ